MKHPVTGEERVLHIRPEDEKDDSLFKDTETGVDLEIVDRVQMTEWLVNNYKNFGATLEFITNRSQEGSQFQKGFGGFGGGQFVSYSFNTFYLSGILRYKVNFQDYDEVVDDIDEFM